MKAFAQSVTRKQWIVGIAIGLFAYAGIGIYMAGRDDVTPPTSTVPVVVGRGNAHGERIKSHSWALDYDKITTSMDQTFVTIDGIHDGVVYKKGKPYLYVKAAHASVNMITKDFSLSGPVRVDSANKEKPRTFTTTSAVWTEAAQRLDLSQPIVVTSPGATLHVARLSLDVRSGNLHIESIDGSLRE
jgi:hypothetical protein